MTAAHAPAAVPATAGEDWARACHAVAAFAVDPQGLGGLALRAGAGPVRDAWLDMLRACLPAGTPVRRMPPGIDDSRLIGGLDLAATLRTGRPVLDSGLLSAAHKGVIVAPMAERMTRNVAGRLAAVLDTGVCVLERDGMTRRQPAAIGLVLLDESDSPDDAPPPALMDRMAISIDLTDVSHRDMGMPDFDTDDVTAARALLDAIELDDTQSAALCETAAALGIGSLRRPLLAARLARALAALARRDKVADDDLRLAAQLALLPYARQLPAPPEDTSETGQEDSPPPEAEDTQPPDDGGESDAPQSPAPESDQDIETEAAEAALPLDLLENLAMQLPETAPASQAGGGRRGQDAVGGRRGRPVGSRHGRPGGGQRLNLLATLRAAAPWQPMRRQQRAVQDADTQPNGGGVLVRPEDFRVTRFKSITETTAIFCVDASGSAALTRLAEAKGAAEIMLGRCYIRRDEVGVIAFRGTRAEVLLPPTRSLTRAKKSLTGLPGGGGTPLATGIRAACALADAERRRGRMPVVILLTDGNANIGLAGAPGRDAAMADALLAARAFRRDCFAGMLIDMSPRGSDKARRIADAMGATYLFLPRKDSASVSRAALDGVDALSGRAA